ncbi:MAG: type II toxin-antitoxin system RelE/ParE family toxin [Dehalococcoidia bacterium]
MTVEWSDAASIQFAALVARLESLSTGAGIGLVDRVTRRLRQIADFPDSGRMVPEFGFPSFRELVEGDYRVVYERFPDRIEVVAVVHGSRSFSEDI